MRHRAKYYIALIVVLTLLITYLHLWFFRDPTPSIVFEELYYIPLLLAALRFGLKGGFLAYVFVSIFYLPFLFGPWAASVLSLIDRILHLLFTGIFAMLAGFLIDRETRREHQLGKDRYLAGLGQAAATIVHDLKNPLISILNIARRIREGKGDAAVAAQVIENSAQTMQKIVEGALDFAKPIRLELEEVDIYHVVQQACNACELKAEERDVVLSVDVPRAPLNMKIDRLHFQRAIVNLTNNAIEASPKGQRVVIDTEREENHVVVRIKDLGSGMDQETLENVFIPFYSRKDKGTGLGMAIAKKIVEGHGGSIHIKSRPGFGTEMMIKLPSHS